LARFFAIILLPLALIASEFEDFEFPEKLAKQGFFRKASIEYLRYAYENPQSNSSDLAKYRAGYYLEKDGCYDQARNIYIELTQNSLDSIAIGAYYRINNIDFLEGKLNRIISFSTFKNLDCSTYCTECFEFQKGWALLLARRYEQSGEIFDRISGSDLDSASEFLSSLCMRGTDLPRRSPLFAASMSSIIPGSGRAYCGRWGDAIVSFISIAASLGGAYYLWEDDRGFAIGLTITGAFLYGGNVYGSYLGARWFNEEKHRELYRYAREKSPKIPEELYRF